MYVYVCARLVQSGLTSLQAVSAQNVYNTCVHASLCSAAYASAVVLHGIEGWWAHQQSPVSLGGMASEALPTCSSTCPLLHAAVQLLH